MMDERFIKREHERWSLTIGAMWITCGAISIAVDLYVGATWTTWLWGMLMLAGISKIVWRW